MRLTGACVDFREEDRIHQELRTCYPLLDKNYHRQHVQGVQRHDTLRSCLTDVHGDGWKTQCQQRVHSNHQNQHCERLRFEKKFDLTVRQEPQVPKDGQHQAPTYQISWFNLQGCQTYSLLSNRLWRSVSGSREVLWADWANSVTF